MPDPFVIFVEEDFREAFDMQNIDIDSLTEEEWRSFDKMFMSGIQWAEVAEIAAQTIADERRNNE